MTRHQHRQVAWMHVGIASMVAVSLVLTLLAENWVAAVASLTALVLAGHLADVYFTAARRGRRASSEIVVHVTADTSDLKRELAGLERRVQELRKAMRS